MGICSSSDSTNVATAKLILQDGRLEEFSYPVKVSYILQKNPTCFICNSDEMDFDDVVTAINGDDVLQPGQLYFALPLNRLKYPLQAEEMAALAVKASSALMKNGTQNCGFRRETFSGEVVKTNRRVAAVTGGYDGGLRRGTRSGGRRKFSAMLNSIPE